MKNIIAFLCLAILTITNLYSFSGKGTGTEKDPYQITDVYQLQEMNDDRNAYYLLMNDIDASVTRTWNIGDHDDNPATPDSAMGFDCIGGLGALSFTGCFNGNGFSIKGIYINRPKQNGIGLIQIAISPQVIIENIVLEDCNITGSTCVGGIVGSNEKATIDNVHITGNIYGSSNVGGLAGSNEATVTNCSFAGGRISGEHNNIGGLIGYNSGDIEASFSKGDVTGHFAVGGLIGKNDNSVLIKTYAIGHVSGYSNIGGLVGQNEAAFIRMSFAAGQVEGEQYAGGLVGANLSGHIYDTYSRSDIVGVYAVGGLIGGNAGHLETSYSTGEIIGDGDDIGGLLGKHEGHEYSIVSIYWDIQTSKRPGSADGEGKYTSDMKNKATFFDAGWDFDTIWAISPEINDGYPYFQWQETELSVKEHLSDYDIDIKIFPNPSTDNINIILPKEAQINFIRISDISGREVKNVSINSYTDNISMNISDLPQGFYIINLFSGGEVYSSAFVVE